MWSTAMRVPAAPSDGRSCKSRARLLKEITSSTGATRRHQQDNGSGALELAPHPAGWEHFHVDAFRQPVPLAAQSGSNGLQTPGSAAKSNF
eukprot:351361-Chlamydomonas_euryale.AAC.10